MTDWRFQRLFLLAVLLGTTILFLRVIRFFLVPILLAAVVASLFYPLYRWLLRRLRGRRNLSALAASVLVILVFLGPLYMVGHLVSLEALDFVRNAQDRLQELREGRGAELLSRLAESPLIKPLQLDRVDWAEMLRNFSQSAARIAANAANRTYRGAFQAILGVFAMLFTLFYFFRDGPVLVEHIRYLLPLDDAYKDAVASRFTSVARATVRGTLLIGVIQGCLGGLTLWIFGVGSPVLWGVVMAILSVIPAVGPWLVLYPAAAIQLVAGRPWMALGIVLVTVVVILNLDNLLRPRLVGQQARMHDLMIFFSTLGGIATFGAAGFIVGPVVAALWVALLESYGAEFRELLRGGGEEAGDGEEEHVAAEPEDELREGGG